MAQKSCKTGCAYFAGDPKGPPEQRIPRYNGCNSKTQKYLTRMRIGDPGANQRTTNAGHFDGFSPSDLANAAKLKVSRPPYLLGREGLKVFNPNPLSAPREPKYVGFANSQTKLSPCVREPEPKPPVHEPYETFAGNGRDGNAYRTAVRDPIYLCPSRSGCNQPETQQNTGFPCTQTQKPAGCRTASLDYSPNKTMPYREFPFPSEPKPYREYACPPNKQVPYRELPCPPPIPYCPPILPCEPGRRREIFREGPCRSTCPDPLPKPCLSNIPTMPMMREGLERYRETHKMSGFGGHFPSTFNMLGGSIYRLVTDEQKGHNIDIR